LRELARWPVDSTVLDFGCGKLRYALPLSRRVKSVTVVDSAVQVDRSQRIGGRITTVRLAAQERANMSVFALAESGWKNRKYDRILCANVLSAIPTSRARRELMLTIHRLLRRTGKALILNQHRNSAFEKYAERADATPYFDGWLIESRSGPRFYGLIGTKALQKLCEASGLHCEKLGVWDQTAYAYVTADRELESDGIYHCHRAS
jgi:SAM-dependent methyltransferase